MFCKIALLPSRVSLTDARSAVTGDEICVLLDFEKTDVAVFVILQKYVHVAF